MRFRFKFSAFHCLLKVNFANVVPDLFVIIIISELKDQDQPLVYFLKFELI